MATTKRMHTEVTLQIKYQTLQELEKGRTCKDIAAKFNVPGSTLSTWKKNKEKIFEAVAEVDDDDEEESTALVSCPSRNEVDEAMEILSKLCSFTTDTEMDPLVTKLGRKINQRRQQ